MSTLDTNDIKIYKDIYANAESALVGFKGKRVDKPGIFYCPYVKPSRLRRFINWVKSLFKKKHEAIEL